MRQNLTIVDDVGPVDKAQCLADVVIRDQDPDATVGQVTDQLLDIADSDGIDAGERLIKENERRPRGQSASNLTTPPFAA